MSIQQKILQYQGLTEYETSIVDSLPTSEYFKVFSLEDTIPGGRSTFQILGSEFLEDGVEIKIELLDINGNPIYTEPIKYLGDDPSRHIMIEVYPDTPAGVGKLTILGSATNVPDEWKGLYNVKWEKDVFIDPVSKNTQPILFRGQGFDLTRNERYPLPEIEISETVTGVVVASGSSGNEFVTSSIFTGGSYKGNASPFARPMEISDLRRSPIEESFGESGHRGFTPTDEGVRGMGGGQTAKSTYAVKSKNQQNASDTTSIETNIVEEKYEEFHPPQAEPTPPPIPKIPPISSKPKTTPPVVETKVKQPDNVSKSTFIKRQGGEPFRLELAGGTFKANPKVSPLVKGVEGQNFQSASFTASILAVHSPDLIELDAPFVVKDETPEKDDSNPFIAVPHEDTSFTIDFEPETTGSTSEVILQSFANITLKNLKTFSGDVHRVKVFTKGFSTQGDFKLVADKLVEGSDILVDTGSVSLSQKIGKFINQNHIDKNWEVKHIKRGPNSETPELAGTAVFTSSAQPPLMNSVLVSGSNSKVDESVLFQTKTPKINLRPNVDYTLFVNAVVKTAKTDVLQNDGSILNNQSKAKVKFYLSGSKLGQDLKDTKPASSGSIGNILGDPIKVVQTDDETQGEVITLESDNNEVGKTIDFGRVKIPFKPQFSGSGVTLNDDTTLQVEVEAGELYIQSIELQPSSDTNFNPDEFTFQVPMPKLRKRPDFFDFLVEFYDRNGNKAGYTTIREAVEFDGENDVIQGTDNLLTGSLSIGNAIGKGIEAAGVDSAFIRSVGYVGFTSASLQGSGGFMMFSGSVLPDSPDSYEGVGLEIHDGNSGSFKFRTHNEDGVGEFDVRTNKFFFGKEGVQFVSGSDDKIEISSSNFHLEGDGTLTIGADANILGGLTATSIQVPDAVNPLAEIKSTGAATFTSASIGGFNVSETAISSSNGELVLKANGQITGSNFKLDGGTISSGVTIDAAVAANSLSLPAVGTKTAVITAQGEATFSKAEIGSFKISTQEIRSLSGSLILSASGAITASDILATGNITANAGQVFQDVTSLHATSGALETDISSSISRSISIEETTGSLLTSASLVRLSLTSSKEESDLVAKGFGESSVLSASLEVTSSLTASLLFVTSSLTSSLEFTSESLEFTRGVTGSLESGISSSVSGSMLVAKEFGIGAVLSASTDATRSISSFNTTITGSFAPIKTDLTQSKGEVFTLQSESTSSRFSLNSSIVRLTQSLDASSSFAGKFITSASILRDNLSGVESSASFLAGGAIVSASTDATSSILVLNTLTSASIATSASFVSASTVIKAQDITDKGIAPIKTDVTQSKFEVGTLQAEATQSIRELGTLQTQATQSLDASSSFAGKFITSASILRDNLGGVESSASFLAGGAIVSASTDATSSILVLNTLTSASIATSGSILTTDRIAMGDAIAGRSASMDATISSSFTLSSASLSLSGSILSGSIGTKINPYETQVSLSGDGLDIKKEDGQILAEYGESIELRNSVIGSQTTASLDTNALIFLKGGVTQSKFGVGEATIGVTTGSHFEVSGSGLRLKDGNVPKLAVDGNGVKVGNTSTSGFATQSFVGIDNLGVNFVKDGNSVGFFGGDTLRVGATGLGLSEIELNASGDDAGTVFKDADNNIVAVIGTAGQTGGGTYGGGNRVIPASPGIRGMIVENITTNQAIVTGSISGSNLIAREINITGSANVGGLVTSGSVRNTSTGAATSVLIHAHNGSNTLFQVLTDGEVLARDNITAFKTSGFSSISDKRLKTDIQPISQSLDKILKLEPKNFSWIENNEKDSGFIAQDVEKVIPEVVQETKGFVDIDSDENEDTKYKTISYSKLTIYLVDAIKELTKRVEELEKENKTLEVD